MRPEVKLGEYKGLAAEREETAVTDEDLDNELQALHQPRHPRP